MTYQPCSCNTAFLITETHLLFMYVCDYCKYCAANLREKHARLKAAPYVMYHLVNRLCAVS